MFGFYGIMDKPDGHRPSDTRSIRVRNILSFLQVAFKIAIHFIARNRGCPVKIPDGEGCIEERQSEPRKGDLPQGRQ